MPGLLACLVAAVVVQPLAAQVLPTSRRQVCGGHGNFFVGEAVAHVSRGPAIVACQSSKRPGDVGICQGVGSGHDNYAHCSGKSTLRPPFCGDRALWFVHCSDLLRPRGAPAPTPSVASRGVSAAARPEVMSDSHHGVDYRCGCSWNTQHGCVVSGQQVIAALTPSTMGSHCAEMDSENCRLHVQVKRVAERFEHCLSLSAASCYQDKDCQWGAQGAHQCGIDEEQFILAVVGPEHHSHPLVRMIQLHDHCNQLSEESCDANPVCRFQVGDGDASWHYSSCDIKPSVMAGILLANPRMVMSLFESTQRAKCDAAAQVMKTLKKGGCPPDCILNTHGGTSLTCDPMPMGHSDEFVQSIYRPLCEDAPGCPEPCVRYPHERPNCTAPPISDDMLRKLPVSPSDEYVVKVLSIMMTSTMIYEEQCAQTDRRQCQAAAKVCTRASDVPKWAKTSLHTGASRLPTPGLKGILATATRAIADGKAGDFINDFLTNHPDDVNRLTSAFEQRFKNLWKQPAKDPATPPVTPDMSRASSKAVTTTSSVQQSQELREEETASAARIRNTLMDPWFAAAVSAIVATICAGVALGTLCHARLLRSQARELGGALLETDRDLPALGPRCAEAPETSRAILSPDDA